MKKVSVKFNTAGRWAVSLEKQIEVKEGQVVNDLPVTFAYTVVDAGRGEIVEPVVEEVKVLDSGDGPVLTILFSNSELESLTVPKLKVIAEKLAVTDCKNKAEWVEGILCAQTYSQEYLDAIEDVELLSLALAKNLVTDDNEPASDDGLTSDETEVFVTLILECQEDASE